MRTYFSRIEKRARIPEMRWGGIGSSCREKHRIKQSWRPEELGRKQRRYHAVRKRKGVEGRYLGAQRTKRCEALPCHQVPYL